MNYPKKLCSGDTLGIVAPASTVSNLDINACVKCLNDLGYKVKLGMSIGRKEGFLSASDIIRAQDINQMFEDLSIDGIICLRGGYGSQRILPLIDWTLPRKYPKVFIGFSDITAIHVNLIQKSKLVTYHGPMVDSTLLKNMHEHSVKSLMDAMSFEDFYNPKDRLLISASKGKAIGQLIGGNLTLIGCLMGTPFELDTRDKILVIEDVGKETFRLDRILVQLKQAGKLDVLKGILIGDFKNCDNKGDQTIDELIEDHLIPLKIPIIKNLAVGHCNPMSTLPLGAICHMDADEMRITFSL